MRRLIFIFYLISSTNIAQTTYVPDLAFEYYLENNGMGNGIYDDHYVYTSNINTVTSLNIPEMGISDLTGLEDFSALEQLICYGNSLTELDVSQNLQLADLYCNDNQITILTFNENNILSNVNCDNNQIEILDFGQNETLSSLDCSNNQLTELHLGNSNLL